MPDQDEESAPTASDLSSGLPDSADLPLAQANPEPLFNDSMFFNVYDPAENIMFFLSVVPNAIDFNLKEEKIILCLPGGDMLTVRAAGRSCQGSRNMVGASALTFTCVEPFKSWLLEFDGGVQTHNVTATLEGRLPDGPFSPLKFRLELTMVSPAWAAGAKPSAGPTRHLGFTSHYQQQSRMRGEMTWNGRTFPLSGIGHRNHSRGPRNFAQLSIGGYAHASFPSGRHFGCMLNNYAGQPPVSSAYMVENGILSEAVLEDFTLLDTFVHSGERVRFSVKGPGGTRKIEGVTLHAFANTRLPPRSVVNGLDRRTPGAAVAWEACARWELDGEVGYGLHERWHPVSALPAASA